MKPFSIFLFAFLLNVFMIVFADGAADEPIGGVRPPGAMATPTGDDAVMQSSQLNNAVYQQVIKNLILRIENLEAQVGQQLPVQQGSGPSGVDPSPSMDEQLQRQLKENRELIHTAFEQRLGKEGGMLLGSGQLVYELGISYAYSSYEKIAIDGFTVFPVLVVGDIVSEKVKRDIITNNHSFRVGLGGDTQLDLVIPLGYEKELFFREDGTSEKRRIEGLGDVTLGISHQIVKSSERWPDTVIALNWKTDTGEDPYRLLSADELALGSGFDTYGLSLMSITNSDPLILFGGVTVNYTDGDHKPVGFVEPGVSYGINLGMALALNFDTSLSFSFQFLDTDKTRIDRQLIDGSNMTTATFAVGLSTAGGSAYAVDIDLGIGLTADSPDFQLSLSFPFDFALD